MAWIFLDYSQVSLSLLVISHKIRCLLKHDSLHQRLTSGYCWSCGWGNSLSVKETPKRLLLESMSCHRTPRPLHGLSEETIVWGVGRAGLHPTAFSESSSFISQVQCCNYFMTISDCRAVMSIVLTLLFSASHRGILVWLAWSGLQGNKARRVTEGCPGPRDPQERRAMGWGRTLLSCPSQRYTHTARAQPFYLTEGAIQSVFILISWSQ